MMDHGTANGGLYFTDLKKGTYTCYWIWGAPNQMLKGKEMKYGW
jgi:hypothetical protein